MKVLELFKGTGSVEKAIMKLYPHADVISVDIEPKFNATITCNIMDLDYKQWKPGYFDIIWASPPCTYYSAIQRISPRSKEFRQEKLEESNTIVRHTLDIIDYLQPKRWYMENPQTGTLKDQDFMQDLPYCDATYCMYGYPYRKQTRFWTNAPVNLKICSRSNKPSAIHCEGYDLENGKHSMALTWNKNKGNNYKTKSHTTLEQRYSIPQGLLLELLAE